MIKPIDDRILVEQHMKEAINSVILVPKEAQESMKLPQGTVVSIGSGESISKNAMKVGDVVFFNEYAGERVNFEEKEYVLLRMGEVLAKKE